MKPTPFRRNPFFNKYSAAAIQAAGKSVSRNKWKAFVTCTILGLFMNCAFPLPAPNAARIAVTREVLLEQGVAASPRSIIRIEDGGYVIVGALHDNQAWGIRIDAALNVMWRHEVPHPSASPAETSSVYESAVALPDNTTLLCGHLNIGKVGAPNVVGLIARIDPGGRVLDQQQLTPLGDGSFKLSYIHNCVSTAEGIAVVGNATQFVGSGPVRSAKQFLWVLRLDNKGEVIWQKTIPRNNQSVPSSILPLPKSNLFVRSGDDESIVLDHLGAKIIEIKGPPGALIKSDDEKPLLRFLSQGVAEAPFVLTVLDADFEEKARKTGRVSNFVIKQVHALTNGDLALFGSVDEGGAATAAVSWLRHDLEDIQTLVFQPTFGSSWVAAAVPTGSAAEFATVRLVLPARHAKSPSETRLGLLLTFVTFRN